MTVTIVGRTPCSSALSAARRSRDLAALGDRPDIDLLVVGGGVTGAGIALDAAARGLRTVLVERHDLAFGTSRWSSKLAHGGLRYLASGQFAIAHESAAERHLLLTRIAPHLTRPLAQVMPLYAPGHMARGAYVGLGYGLGDGLRRFVGTPDAVLSAPSAIGSATTRQFVPAVRTESLRGGLRGWDGQLIDDARLVIAIARTAAGYGASILTRVEALDLAGDAATLRDTLTGETLAVRSRVVLNATGVWASDLAADVHLRPSRGTHLVVDTDRLGGSDVSLTVPVEGSTSRFVFTVPSMHGRTYIGLTDVPADGAIPDVPYATDAEIDMLLATMNTVLAEPLRQADVLATFAGLRPLLTDAGGAQDATSDVSRRHAILESATGVLTVVGGKLTTYRRMAQDGVDEAVRRRLGPGIPPSSTRTLPLVGAWPRHRIAEIPASPRYVRRYGAEAPFVAALPGGMRAARGVTAQELRWGVLVEGALTVGDLLDRRTRLGLVDADRAESVEAAASAFGESGPVASLE
ncbi:glycerol-3-phosphate dehydrogenase/oxidase [Microbacterium pygmaeum]|uniref:Glycerol-3-phosphate dehydrogenase n=1 Tax=Microbacterium pygmaeum TaxID=370764 RepID=A0A1G8CJ89_9MICO|nr:glycerol-3-phosphate dehydrogenase/oxidase [Microbacterium pygmaeum]SDH45442.1 glycerol-3-phosphate dehydrogenase [Microbacterium pygmaeum]